MWHRDTKWEKNCQKNGGNRLAWHRVMINFQFVKTASVKYNKMRYAGMPVLI